MRKFTRIPAITGKQLIKLLRKDGWVEHRRGRHGVVLKKTVNDRTLVTVVPTANSPLDDGTLEAILGPKQTKVGKDGLLQLINKYGL